MLTHLGVKVHNLLQQSFFLSLTDSFSCTQQA